MEGTFAPITNSMTFWTYMALAYSFVLMERRSKRESPLFKREEGEGKPLTFSPGEITEINI
jgi:hypothetical protein